jgi:hypothetical protein
MTEAASLRHLLGSDSLDSRVAGDAGTTEEDSQILQETSFVEDVSEDPFAGAFWERSVKSAVFVGKMCV